MYALSDNSIQRNEHPRPRHAGEDQAERADVYSRLQNAETPIREHDLEHTFGRRLLAAGVSFEDRQDLLGHKSGRITTHYSQTELSNLIAAAQINLSHAFAGQKVGIKEVSDQIWLVSFMQYDLGFFDHETRIESAENPFSAKVSPMSRYKRYLCNRNRQ
jgi:hypothetical protein